MLISEVQCSESTICILFPWSVRWSPYPVFVSKDHPLPAFPRVITTTRQTLIQLSSVQFSLSVMSNSLRPMNHSTPGLPVHHQLPEFTQTHVHWVSDATQPSHPLSSPSPPSPNPSQHQSLFQCINSLHEVDKVLNFQLQHHSLQRNPRADLLQNGLVGSPCSPRDSQESSPTPQFKSIRCYVLVKQSDNKLCVCDNQCCDYKWDEW